MTGALLRDGDEARKPAATEIAAELVRRTDLLVALEVRTPRLSLDENGGGVTRPWIPGCDGRDLIRAVKPYSAGLRDRTRVDMLRRSLRLIGNLHAVQANHLELAPHQPWKRISPRLDRLTMAAAADPGVLRAFSAAAGQLREALRGSLDTDAISHPGVIHGDFHAGQVVFPDADEGPWLVDLDDLAAGPRESDLGQFVAHLLTLDFETDEMSAEHYLGLEMLVLSEIPAVNRRLLRHHAVLNLLRRALKGWQRRLSPSQLHPLLELGRNLLEIRPLPR